MNIEKNAWHARWHLYWLENGRGNQPGYQENLCHYFWVIVFWAPMTWIDQHTQWDWGKVVGWAFVSLVILYLGGIASYGLYIAATTQTTKFLMGVGSFAGLVGLIATFVGAYRLSRDRELRMPGTVKLVASYAVAKKRHICPFIEFVEPLSND